MAGETNLQTHVRCKILTVYLNWSPQMTLQKIFKARRAFFSLMLSCLLLFSVSAQTVDDYKPGIDSKPQDGVPKGEVLKFSFAQSKIFPGTTRDYWIYIPAQYKPDQ